MLAVVDHVVLSVVTMPTYSPRSPSGHITRLHSMALQGMKWLEILQTPVQYFSLDSPSRAPHSDLKRAPSRWDSNPPRRIRNSLFVGIW